MKNIRYVFAALTLLFSAYAVAQAPSYTIKQIGASFAEPPPSRDKELVPHMSQIEQVTTTAVLSFKDRMVVDAPMFGDSTVLATATLASGGTFDLGTAEADYFRRISADRQKVTVIIGVKRLPDQPVKSVRFTGTVKVMVAAGTKTKQVDFKPPLVGTKFDAGLGPLTLSKIENNSFTFDGDESLNKLHGLTLTLANGTVLTAQRNFSGRMGNSFSSSWGFQGATGPGRLEFQYYDSLQTVAVPIDLSVVKPY